MDSPWQTSSIASLDPALASHTADSGDTWTDPASDNSVAGGAAYLSGGSWAEGAIPVSSWTPPGTDYEAQIVLGASAVTIGNSGVGLRLTGSSGSQSYYLLEVAPTAGVAVLAVDLFVAPSTYTNLISLTGVAVAANDVFGVTVAGSGATVTLTVTHNGTEIGTAADTSSGRLVTAGSLGLRIPGGTGDQMRTLWAGAIGGPSETISPSVALLALSGTQTFTAGGVLPTSSPTEVIAWSAGTGTVDSTGHYTAPATGSSDTVTWTSFDLPTHTATASITLMAGSAARINGAARGRPSVSRCSSGWTSRSGAPTR